jgi:hypothetical protein
MTDGRTISTCSLGPMISGEVAASDSLQENGLIRYKGSVELQGVFRPSLGTVVTFDYTIDGTTYQVPKKMRVLSFFSNPLTKTTSVELGCLLTYKSDEVAPEIIDTVLANRDLTGSTEWAKNPALQTAFPSSWSQNKDGGGTIVPAFWDEDYKQVGASISAAWAANYCLAKLGITATSMPLQNQFRMQEFDFTSGWVNVLSDLLQSECYIGELDYDENLVIRSLTDETATGPVIYQDDIRSIGSIGAGGLPAEAIGVYYKSWSFPSVPDHTKGPWTAGGGVGSAYVGTGTSDTGTFPPLLAEVGIRKPLPEDHPAIQKEREMKQSDRPGWDYSESNGPETESIVRYKQSKTSTITQLYTNTYNPSSVRRTSYQVVGGQDVELPVWEGGGFININGKLVPVETIETSTSIISAEQCS